MSSLLPATVRLSLEEFSRHGGLTGPHKDGWGIAFYAGRAARIFREALPASDSAQIRFIQEHPPQSTFVLSHIRKATQGTHGLKNCQPFSRELGGRMHVFSHNGDLQRERLLREQALGTFLPVGDTDSEHAFCALMARMRPLWTESDEPPSVEARLAVVTQFAREIQPLGPANFIYSDGDVLFAHGHRRTQPEGRGILPPGLHQLRRSCTAGGEGMATPGLTIDAPHAEQHVVIIASVPLTDESDWEPLDEGEVLVLREGEIIARSR